MIDSAARCDFNDLLLVAVTCTMDASREHALGKLLRSIESEHLRTGFAKNLLIFDNGSARTLELEKLRVSAAVVRSPENLGYWGALHWSLRHAPEIFGRSHAFVHPVESDLCFFEAGRLARALAWLRDSDRVETVRTQEFRVASRNRFFKGRGSLFPVRRSRVADYNGVTEAPVWFDPVPDREGVFVTNWHAKVPALHRFEMLDSVLAELASQETLTEHDFMRCAHARCGEVGLLDGGIYYANLNDPGIRWLGRRLTGSYASPEALLAHGYRATRVDRIEPGTLERDLPVGWT